ncbi:MAG: hypothetical protein KatS3mg090_0828 [Patescibacteria group bacterium]|nr:MAG: hypothetical protein KatS3mg090_0828 [Patescibacteria group bacterium]
MRIYFLGIKGWGMVNLSLLAKDLGHTVSGYDVADKFPTDEYLDNKGIVYDTDLKESNIDMFNPDLVVYTGAHGGVNNPLVVYAKSKNIKVLHQSEYIRQLQDKFQQSVLIAGTHGKTTTTSLTAFCLYKLVASIGYYVGTTEFSGLPAGAFFGNKYFVLEADEYAVSPPVDMRIKLKLYKFDHLIIPALDYDHPDVYKDFDDVLRTFYQYILSYPESTVYLNIKDKGVLKLYQLIKDKHKNIITVSDNGSSDLSVSSIDYNSLGSKFRLFYKKQQFEFFHKTVR